MNTKKKKAGFKFNLRFNSACRPSNNWALNVIFTGFKEHSRFDKKLKEMLKVILFMNNANREIKYYYRVVIGDNLVPQFAEALASCTSLAVILVYFVFFLEYGDILMKNDFVGIFIFMLSGLYMTRKNKVTVASVIFYHLDPVVFIKNVTRRRLSFFSRQNSQTYNYESD